MLCNETREIGDLAIAKKSPTPLESGAIALMGRPLATSIN